jgi:hypothetical protein
MPLVVRTNEGSPRAFRAWPLAWPRRQARRVGSGAQGSALALASDATAGSALDAGGADPDNARRSGPVSWPFAGRLAHLAGDDWSGQLAERMTHSALRRGSRHGGVRDIGASGSARDGALPRKRKRARLLPTCGESPHHSGRHGEALSRLVQHFSVHVPHLLHEMVRCQSAWRTGGAPLVPRCSRCCGSQPGRLNAARAAAHLRLAHV